MRVPYSLMSLGAAFMLGSARMAFAAQDPVKVEVTTTDSHSVWYADPVWIAIGVVVFLLVVVLMIAGSRSGKKTTTTVIR